MNSSVTFLDWYPSKGNRAASRGARKGGIAQRKARKPITKRCNLWKEERRDDSGPDSLIVVAMEQEGHHWKNNRRQINRR
jgi:hypothetical protein